MRTKFKIDTESAKREAKLIEIYKATGRTPEFYLEAGKRFRSNLERCRENKWKETIVSIKETITRHRDALIKLDMKDHAKALMEGFKGK